MCVHLSPGVGEKTGDLLQEPLQGSAISEAATQGTRYRDRDTEGNAGQVSAPTEGDI